MSGFNRQSRVTMADTTASEGSVSRSVTGPRVALAVGGLVVLVAGQQFGSLGRADLFGQTLSNALHIPLFAAITLLLATIFPRRGAMTIGALGCLLAALTELAQLFNSRHASVTDFGLDLLGVGPVVLGLALTRRLHASADGSRSARVLVWGAVALVVAVLASVTPGRVLLAYAHRDEAFPVLLEAGASALAPLVSSNSLTRPATAPAGWPGYAHGPVLEVLWAAERYPGITLDEVVPDWSGYSALAVDVFLPDDVPASLTAAVRYEGEHGTAAHLRLPVRPGPQRLIYPLTALLEPRGGRLPRVRSLVLHTHRDAAGRRLLIGRVTLTAE